MFISINGFKYKVRTKATYLANDTLKEIGRRYFWKYAPPGFFMPNGSVALIDDPNGEIIGFEEPKDGEEQGKDVIKKVPRELTEEERQLMIVRMYSDVDYKAEMLDFHLSPVGYAPLLSTLLETYTPTEEEQEEMANAQTFFYANGTESNPKKEESTTDTPIKSHQEKADTTLPGT